MPTHYESSGKKSKLEKIFEFVEQKLSGIGKAIVHPGAEVVATEDKYKKRTIEQIPQQLDKSMKGKY